MNREQYLKELRKYLKRLPKEDYENAMEYFTEYFDDVKNDDKAIRELGSPREAASELLAALLDQKARDPFANAAVFQSSDGDFSSENTTYTGDCAFNLSYGDIIFRLDDSQKEALSMDLKTNYGDISIAENLPNSAYTQYGDEDTKSYQKTGTANGGTLSVYCDDGDITIK